MAKEEEKGTCFFAYNNSQLDYIRFAHVAAGYVKANMKNNDTCLITDTGGYAWLKESIDEKWHDVCFDHIVIDDLSSFWFLFQLTSKRTSVFKSSTRSVICDMVVFTIDFVPKSVTQNEATEEP